MLILGDIHTPGSTSLISVPNNELQHADGAAALLCHQRDGVCVGVGGGPTLVYSVHSVKSTDIMMTNTYAGQAGDCVD